MVAVAPAPARALVLIGFMGAGKSTVAAELAGALGVSASDSDVLLADRLGHSIAAEIERTDGTASARSGRPRRSSCASCSREQRPAR